mgnify:FL=1
MEAQNLLRKREPYWDNVKGVLILLVTFAHFMPAATGTVSGAIYEGIYFFHMPLFIFVSGLFYKEEKIRARIIGLVLIGLTYNAFLIMIDNILLGYEQEFFLIRVTKIPWFVFCIAGCSLITYLTRDINPVIVMVISLFLACVACYDHILMEYMTLSKVIGWYPFFYLGVLFKRREWKKLLDENSSVTSRFMGVVACSYFVLVIKTRGMRFNIFTYAFLFGC